MTSNPLNTTLSVSVFSPASVANMACGYDILGFALEKPGDCIVARWSDRPGLHISDITGVKEKLPYEIENNTAGFAAKMLLDHLGETRGIALEIHKQMPFGSGLGSSAASAAGAVVAVNELLGSPLEKKDLLSFAVHGEQVADGAFHADNVAPALLGGIILVCNNSKLDVVSLPVPTELFAAVAYPHVKILTRTARDILSKTVPLSKSVEQSGNLGGLIAGLYTSDYELIGRSLQDVIIEPQRSQLIPHFADAKEAALMQGALGCSVSGAGPSMFCLTKGRETAALAAKAMQEVFVGSGIACDVFVSPINQQGAHRIAKEQ